MSAQKITAIEMSTLLSTSFLQTLQKCSWNQLPALKIVVFGRVQLCRDKDGASYCLANIPNVTVNTLSLAGLCFFYSETNTDAKLWDCDQPSHHNTQAQGQVHKIHETEALRLDLTLLPWMKVWCVDSLQNTRGFDSAKYSVIRDKGKPQQFHSASEDAWIPGSALPDKR